ncbi:prolyl endopeptidase-like [Acipenser ruthenus]|uniref:prolyl endopeptidase-like n=1 Tax=Acipenser ruthenus TaxID=7906 RepID=UPI002740D307|nr:prolyl endopeptidase-like [Acipenser ruthenus]XP_058880699.1 prolyl endopeptidase-like [Acipenser ruthenus]XP_058880700.1 prolyl endopeptidase-like [Acipenser ruthenus]
MSSKDKRFLAINCNSKSCSEMHLVECRSSLLPPVLVQPRTAGLIYHVEHSEGQLYILTNAGPAHEYQLPQWACALEPGLNSQLSSNTFHFLLSSPAQPPRALFYSLCENHLYQQQEEQAMACRTDYQMSRIEAQSMNVTVCAPVQRTRD